MKTIVGYFRGSIDELKKVHWPNRKIVQQYSTIVMVSIVLTTIIFGLADYGLQELVNYFFLRS